jgi:ABC-type glycerol-3-phosphate transport system substrate-binding protein
MKPKDRRKARKGMKGTMGKILAVILIAMGVAGCGSGGGGGAQGTADGKVSTKVKMPYSAEGLPVTGLQLTINIPLGVTVPVDPLTGQAAKSVVKLSGATNPDAVLVAVDYVPATVSSHGILKFLVIDPNGFTPSEYVSVTLDITPGYFPKESDFTIDDYIVTYMDGTTNYDLIPKFTVVIT